MGQGALSAIISGKRLIGVDNMKITALIILFFVSCVSAQITKTIQQGDIVVLKGKSVSTMELEGGSIVPIPVNYKIYYNIRAIHEDGTAEVILNRQELVPSSSDTVTTVIGSAFQVNDIVGIHHIECWPTLYIPENDTQYQNRERATRTTLTLIVQHKNDLSLPNTWIIEFN